MPNNRLVRDTNSAKLGGNKRTTKKSDAKGQNEKAANEQRTQVTHGNAPILTVKFLELLLLEQRKTNAHIEKALEIHG
jgi:hypothetical protein